MKLDPSTAALIFAIAAVGATINLYFSNLGYEAKFERMEKALRGYCIGDPKRDFCAELDLPLKMEK